jgi:hypothetical protein
MLTARGDTMDRIVGLELGADDYFPKPFFTLTLIALAVGTGAYPVVRRLTSRLERLQVGVESASSFVMHAHQ